MPVVLYAEPPVARSTDAAHAGVLRGRLDSLRHEPGTTDATVTTCLVWVAGTLVRIAGDMADPRSAGVLMREAAAVLAAATAGVRPVPPPAPPPAPLSSPASVPLFEPLTTRQLAVLCRLQEGASLRQIADGLYVSHNTVKSHVRAVYRKLGVGSRAEAVRRARALGLV
ncbi:helix-turn-helix transcriptional regulator [Streptomyces kunmingensis]|uniref:Helix-turn-helix transcriptional regulator n=1 Tax=Streptomyces kunmingensis TaxID=68225 RepID=A0ABU6C540_9ACTN|nr:helix-turn-helix transcriptional regulator [Streptomyces kunmingensis]MEB3959830.1 helix-turn-helix transcriptional regulator [Streptomyces kunmingensis]